MRTLLLQAPFFAVAITAAIACRPTAAATPDASASPASTVPGMIRMPDTLGAFRMDSSWVIRGYATDTSYRYRDGTSRMTVIRYPIRGEAPVGTDSGALVTREGKQFEAVQVLLVQRGTIEAFQKGWDTTEVLDLGGRRVTEHTAAMVVRARGRITVEMQHLYIVNGRFLKVRASLPTSRIDSTSIWFARSLVTYLHRGTRAQPAR